MPRRLAVFVSAGDFLSSWMAKTPEQKKNTIQHQTESQSGPALTFALVDQEPAGPSEVDAVSDLQALQVLAHLPALGELWMNVFEINLPETWKLLQEP